VILSLTGIVLFVVIGFLILIMQNNKSFEAERIRWEAERKDLCSRIQARDYPEYNNGEVKKIKAEKQEHDPMKNIEIV
jgi:hypothetical protein